MKNFLINIITIDFLFSDEIQIRAELLKLENGLVFLKWYRSNSIGLAVNPVDFVPAQEESMIIIPFKNACL